MAQAPGGPRTATGTTTTPAKCVPGATFHCACPQRATGVQACRPDGSGLGPCDCPPPPPPEDPVYYDEEPVFAREDPKYLPYDDGQEIPAGYQLTTRVRTGWLITGVAVFAGLYFYTGLVEGVDENDSDPIVFLPGLGPIIHAITNEDEETAIDFILVVDGLAQIAAVVVAVWALTDQRKLLIRDDLVVVPFVTPNGGGIGLSAAW